MTHQQTIGTRAQVWHGTAKKTSGGLSKAALMMNKHGRIVSRKKHNTAKREKRLVKAGFLTKKGQFGFIKKGRRGKSKKMRGGAEDTDPGPLPPDSDSESDDDDDKMGGRRRRGSRKMRGGMYALSPSPISGIKDTSGVDLQFVAGSATM
jgi:hypothetical protein